MAINKETNGYTFGFAIALVAVVGTVLALLAMGLKPMKDRNAEVKKQMEILSALMDLDAAGINRQNAPEEFKKFINLEEAVVLDMNGNVKEGVEAFDVDIQTEYKDKTLAEKAEKVAKESGKPYQAVICKRADGTEFSLFDWALRIGKDGGLEVLKKHLDKQLTESVKARK